MPRPIPRATHEIGLIAEGSVRACLGLSQIVPDCIDTKRTFFKCVFPSWLRGRVLSFDTAGSRLMAQGAKEIQNAPEEFRAKQASPAAPGS